MEEHMKTLRQLCGATILSLTLAISAFAGHIDCPGVVATTPPQSATSTNITTTVILTILSVIR
jgi:hypothetical protein